MILRVTSFAGALALWSWSGFPAGLTAAEEADAARLVAALLGDTPLVGDLEALTDQIGGRATGSPANERAVDWALARFRDASVEARKEPFTMPGLWLERSAVAESAVTDSRSHRGSPRCRFLQPRRRAE